MSLRPHLPFAALALAVAPAAQDPAAAPATPAGLEWGPREAEHLLNRAAFGATPAEVRAAVADGLEATVERLLAGPGEVAPLVDHAPLTPRDGVRPPELAGRARDRDPESMSEEDRDAVRGLIRDIRRSDREQLEAYRAEWVTRMLDGVDPLRERMTLFWHGHFTSEYRTVRSSYKMIEQGELFREHALGSFDELLRDVCRDPAMLVYLDGASNRKDHPNENFARELMELFTLGEGHYTEQDVQEAARAFTGMRLRGDRVREGGPDHDRGVKTVLGVRGRHDADDVVDILLDRPECGAHVAGALLAYFEGAAPSEARAADYGAYLAAQDYALTPFLRRLFTDPAFYRDEAIATRVASPVDYLVGTARRLELDAPPLLVIVGANLLGERLLDPPNVKGWDGGMAWITTASLMSRGNLVGVLLGEVGLEDFLNDEELADALGEEVDAEGMGGGMAMDDAPGPREALGRDLSALRMLDRRRSQPRTFLRARALRDGARTDADLAAWLCDTLLAWAPPQETVDDLAGALAAEREALGVADGALLDDRREGDAALRRVAHLLLSLPEAQLH